MKVVKKTIYHFRIYFIKPCLKIRDAWGFAHKGGMVNASTVDDSAGIINKKRWDEKWKNLCMNGLVDTMRSLR